MIKYNPEPLVKTTILPQRNISSSSRSGGNPWAAAAGAFANSLEKQEIQKATRADKLLGNIQSQLNADRNFEQAQTNSDRNHDVALQKLGIARTNAGKPDYKIITETNPYTGEEINYMYNNKAGHKAKFKKVDFTAKADQPVMGGTEQPVMAANDVPTNSNKLLAGPVVQSAIPTEAGPVPTQEEVDFTKQYIAAAEGNPDVGTSGAPVAGPGGTIGSDTDTGPTFGKPDRWGVSQGSNGTFRDSDGNYIIPKMLRKTAAITRADGTPDIVIYNSATGKDAKGNSIGAGSRLSKPTAEQVKDEDLQESKLGPFKRIKKTYNKDFVGPFDSRIEGAKSNLGIGDKDFNTFQGNLRSLTNVVRNDLFGSALTASEISEWIKAAPVDSQNETEFIPKYDSFIDSSIDKMTMAKNRHLRNGDTDSANRIDDMIKEISQYKLGGNEVPEGFPQGTSITDGFYVFPDGTRSKVK